VREAPSSTHSRVESLTHNPAWAASAACREADASMFFAPEGEREAARQRRQTQAQAICQDCPVLALCRDYALATDEPYGIWGGMTELDRRRHNRRRGRGGHRLSRVGKPRSQPVPHWASGNVRDHLIQPGTLQSCPTT
jgi:WhiB family redox-sensing transcriptional regulator